MTERLNLLIYIYVFKVIVMSNEIIGMKFVNGRALDKL